MTETLPDVRPAPFVRATVSDDGGVLLDLRGRGRWLVLSPTAALWWGALAEGRSADGAAQAVADDYAVPFREVCADVAVLIDDLCDRGLLMRSAPPLKRGRR